MINGTGVAVPCFEARFEDEDLYNFGVLETRFDGGAYNNVEFDANNQLMLSLNYSLLILKEKIREFDSFLSILLPQKNHNNNYCAQLVSDGSTSFMAFSSMANMMQKVVETASSMMLNCQAQAAVNNNIDNQGLFVDGDNMIYNWYVNNNNTTCFNNSGSVSVRGDTSGWTTTTTTTVEGGASVGSHDQERVVEPEVVDLLASYSHCCQVCGKGFKREANLKMHMRAHGDKYKTSLVSNNALNKKIINEEINNTPRKYSCPHKGCRWNKDHVKFQPLKSIVCVRNHYKRTHCPKMFVCKRCNMKEFSVLSDLKTHEKHCGDVKWCCSCGSSFSKKDKLMDHVALFVGHTPLIYPLVTNLVQLASI